MAIKRFPIAVTAVYLATLALMIYLQIDYSTYSGSDPIWLVKVFITGVLGFFLYYATYLFAETKKVKGSELCALMLAPTALLVLFYVFQLHFFEYRIGEAKTVYRTMINFMMAFALAVSLPFFALKDKNNAIWQYVVKLGIRIAEAFVIFGIMYGGIAAILASVDTLFDVWIKSIVYQQVFTALAGFVATVFVLAGIPKDLTGLEKDKAYPKFIDVLTKYVLVPLILIYAVVIYAYLIRIIVLFEWPEYGVAELISGFLIVGLGTYVLSFIERGKDSFKGKFHKWFFVIALPLVITLFVGMGVRIDEFGFTINRYFVVAFGAMFLAISAYYLLSKKKDLKWIPVIAVIFGVLVSYGPLSAYSISWMSQTQRIENELAKGAEADGWVVRSSAQALAESTYPNRLEVYLNDITQNNEFDLDEDSSPYLVADDLVTVIGLEVDGYESSVRNDWFSYYLDQKIEVMSVEGYAYLIDFDFYSHQQATQIGEEEIELTFEDNILEVEDYFEYDLSDFVEQNPIDNNQLTKAEDLRIEGDNYVIQLENLSGTKRDGLRIESVNGYILVK